MQSTTLLDKENISPLRCSVFTNVTLHPQIGVGMIVDKASSLFACGAFCENKALPHVHGLPGFGRVNAQLPYVPAEKVIDEEVIFGGEFLGYSGQWGHFLLETLQRLWYVKQKKLPIVWLAPEVKHGDITQFYKKRHEEVFHNLGINNEHIIVKEPTLFSKVHFPEPGLGISGYAHPDHMDFLGYHEGAIRKGRYVYLSRSNYNHCTNEKELEDLLRQRGWEIVFPENLSLSEQLDIMTTAQVCMMIAGSAQHTLLLTKNSQTRFIMLPRIHTKIYDIIANFKSDNYYILNAPRHVLATGDSENTCQFTLDINFLKTMLENTANFTHDLSKFAHAFITRPTLNAQDLTLPQSYYTKDCTVTKLEEYFYGAILAFRCNKYEEAYRVLLYLYTTKKLEFYMYDQFFLIIEQYDAIHGTKTELPYDKKQFYLERGKMLYMQKNRASTNS